MSVFLKIDQLRYLAAGVYLSEAPSPSRFLVAVVKQFCRFALQNKCFFTLFVRNTQCWSIELPGPDPSFFAEFGFRL
jgi:hypothetical protein